MRWTRSNIFFSQEDYCHKCPLYLAHFSMLVHSGRIQDGGENNWIWALCLTINISAKCLCLMGTCFVVLNVVNQKFLSVFLTFTFTFTVTLSNRHNKFLIHTDTASNKKNTSIINKFCSVKMWGRNVLDHNVPGPQCAMNNIYKQELLAICNEPYKDHWIKYRLLFKFKQIYNDDFCLSLLSEICKSLFKSSFSKYY